jgi:hypothetical protein
MTGFANLIGGKANYAGADQGVDFTGPGPVYALDDAIVTRAQTGGTGWPGEGSLLVYQLLGGPHKGRHVYIAEDFRPTQRVGARVKKGQTLGIATGSGRAPGIEVGWAKNAAGSAFGTIHDGKPNGPAPKFGQNFAAYASGSAGGGSSSVLHDLLGPINDTLHGNFGAGPGITKLQHDAAGLPGAAVAAGGQAIGGAVFDWIKGSGRYAAVVVTLVLGGAAMVVLGLSRAAGLHHQEVDTA